MFELYQRKYYNELTELLAKIQSFNGMFVDPRFHLGSRLIDVGYGEVHVELFTLKNNVSLIDYHDPESVIMFLDAYAVGVVDGRTSMGPANYIGLPEYAKEAV